MELKIISLPPIGTEWQGGIYAGIVAGRDGQPDYHLIVGPELSGKDGEVDWGNANALAAEVNTGGHNDFTLPDRHEQSIMFGNVPQLFQKRWYWSREQRAGSSVYAWAQGFGNGDQNGIRKGDELRARAVRRLPI
jgi:hypothetical protein